MAYEIWTAAIGAASGLVSGGIASVVAPWINWGIEKKRLERQRRYDLLKSWREGIARMETDDRGEYISSDWYETMRPYMWETRRDELERPGTVIVPADSGRGIKGRFASEADRIESQWGLRPR